MAFEFIAESQAWAEVHRRKPGATTSLGSKLDCPTIRLGYVSAMDRVALLPVLTYAPHHRRPGDLQSSRDAINRALAGHRIEIWREIDFITLYHVFDRTPARYSRQLVRARIGDDRWHVFVIARPESNDRN
jgi:hypothetical protein